MCECKRGCFFLPNPCLCDCSTQQLKQRSTLDASHWRGPHCLNIAVVLTVVHGLLGPLRVGARGRVTHSSPLPPPTHAFSPSLTSHLACLDVKQHVNTYFLLPNPSHIALCVQVLLLLQCV